MFNQYYYDNEHCLVESFVALNHYFQTSAFNPVWVINDSVPEKANTLPGFIVQNSLNEFIKYIKC